MRTWEILVEIFVVYFMDYAIINKEAYHIWTMTNVFSRRSLRKMKKKMTGLTMAVLLSLGQGVHAAEVGSEPLMTFSLDEIVVTATRTEHKAKEVPAATQVITEEEIKRSGSNSLRDLFSLETNFLEAQGSRRRA